MDEFLTPAAFAFALIGLILASMFTLVLRRRINAFRLQEADLVELANRNAALETANGWLERKLSDLTSNLAQGELLVQQRLGIELHDGPAQLLVYILMQTDELAAGPRLTEVPKLAANIRRAAETALSDLRAVSRGLFIGQLDAAAARADSLKTVVLAHELRTGRAVATEGIELIAGTPEAIRACASQVVREALSNGFRHAGGQGQSVRVRWEGALIRIVVADTGPGFPMPSPEALVTMGLAGMRQRTEAVGGTMAIRSRPGEGTELIFDFPLGP